MWILVCLDVSCRLLAFHCIMWLTELVNGVIFVSGASMGKCCSSSIWSSGLILQRTETKSKQHLDPLLSFTLCVYQFVTFLSPCIRGVTCWAVLYFSICCFHHPGHLFWKTADVNVNWQRCFDVRRANTSLKCVDTYESSICCYFNLDFFGQPPLQDEIPPPPPHLQNWGLLGGPVQTQDIHFKPTQN